MRIGFNFDLPAHLVAQEPLDERSGSRLLCLDRSTGEIEHALFASLPQRLNENDLLVFNNTRVILRDYSVRSKPVGALRSSLSDCMEMALRLLKSGRAKARKKVIDLCYPDDMAIYLT